MNNKFRSIPIKSSEITSYSQYLSRRDFLKAAGIDGVRVFGGVRAQSRRINHPCDRSG